MCRIFGCFGKTLPVSELALSSRQQFDGGPDTQRFASGAGWSLGMNRLAIVNPEGGSQPFRLGAITVVYNGEIYNHAALRHDLRARGFHITDRCDGAILPALYAVYGPNFVDRLDGMYALAVIDERERPRILLATDHAGMKPLYWFWSEPERALYFSSELRGLFAFSNVPMEFSETGLDIFLALKYRPGPGTMFHGVSVLLPGQNLTVDDSGLSLRFRTATVAPRADASLEHSLTEGVADLLVADVPACVVTSGGIDSSLVTMLAATVTEGLHSFNIGYVGDWPGDERGFADMVAKHCGTVHHQVVLDPRDIPLVVTEMALAIGQPNGAPISVSTYTLFEQIAAAGFRVALTGDGSDEIFGGYWHAVQALAMGESDWWPSYSATLISLPAATRTALYSPDYRHRIADEQTPEAWLAQYVHKGSDRLDMLTEFELAAKFPNYHLMRVDHLSMAHSVEARLPFCQREVIAHARSMPSEQKIAADRGKIPLAEMARDRLPAAVVNRPKQPFTLPLVPMMLRTRALWEFVESTLTDPTVRRDGQLDAVAIEQAMRRFRTKPTGVDAQLLWSLSVHQVWREAFRSEFRCRARVMSA
ncbi:asparagine synthase (glutamine-hydrolyzing) [Nocardia brasiliensis]|uniref:asparagine synthase (glutamine-hydrolyzing) n=1 Tax=Nocardia brasiliensis TaxID=37326 RepID=UPI0018956B34|nr:asparagine synthase (glutamine-hydrolyzing) [Nocardia brasiliensis]MBF6546634.1 asparagine synthase (glutamine-hydrolyzing) [Nocardia brasiliensis]